MAALDPKQDAYLRNARDIYTQINRVGRARKKEGADQKALDDTSQELVDRFNDLNKQFGYNTSLRDVYSKFEQEGQKAYETYSKTGKLPSDLRREAEAVRSAGTPISAISDAVKDLASVNDEANSWVYASGEKDQVREELRKKASQAYEAATPEQRAQNKDLIASAAKLLNPPATPSSIAASDPTSQPAEGAGVGGPIGKAPTSQTSSIDPQQAARDLMIARQSGSGLAAYDAMQNPAYELGSGSSLRQRRRIGTQSGDMRREARRLRKQGYGKAAERMALAASQQKLGEGSAIRTQGDITSQMQDQSRMQGQLSQIEGLNQRMIEYQNRLLDRRMRQLDEEDEDNGPSYTLLNE